MPTLPPPPVLPPVNEIEKLARDNALKFMTNILSGFYNYTYRTRSHVPGGNDCTDFFDALNKIKKWIQERPDWEFNLPERFFNYVKVPMLEWMGDDPKISKKLSKPIT